MQGPSKIGLRAGVGPATAAGDHIGVAEMLDGVERDANASADERRNGPPGAEVDISVDERHPLRLASAVVIGEVGPVEVSIERVKARLAAIFAGHVGAEPVVPLIADTQAIERRTVESTLVEKGELLRRGERWMRDIVEELIALADIAPQIPAPRLHRRLVRRQISSERPRAYQYGRCCERKHLHTTHDFVLSYAGRQPLPECLRGRRWQ